LPLIYFKINNLFDWIRESGRAGGGEWERERGRRGEGERGRGGEGVRGREGEGEICASEAG